MLVLSRRLNEKIVIPCIAAAVQVVSIKPGMVRLGIDAPPDITVLREEVLVKEAEERPLEDPRGDLARRLNAATTRLALLRRQLVTGQTAQAPDTLDRIEQELRALQRSVNAPAPPSDRHCLAVAAR
jgi:carbon storage regulator CsrA